MKLLAVDTALGACSCAVLDDARVLAHRFEAMERGHAERLAPMAEDVMREAGLAFSQLEKLAVTVGPGTFTGQRVGLAFARGLRVALHIGLVGVTTLEAMAMAAMNQTGISFGAALHDAKRGEVYFQLLKNGQAVLAPALAPLDTAVSELARAAASAPMVFSGTAAEAAVRLYPGKASATPIRAPDALWVGRIALGREVPPQPPKPLYLRPPDAKPWAMS